MFAGGDMVAERAHRHYRGRPRQEGGAAHRRLAARQTLTRRAESTRSSASPMLHLPIYSDADSIPQRTLETAAGIARASPR